MEVVRVGEHDSGAGPGQFGGGQALHRGLGADGHEGRSGDVTVVGREDPCPREPVRRARCPVHRGKICPGTIPVRRRLTGPANPDRMRPLFVETRSQWMGTLLFRQSFPDASRVRRPSRTQEASMPKRLLLSIPLLAALATPLAAQEGGVQPDTVLMEKIQAVATRTERATFDVPTPVDVLDGERIDRLQADNVVADLFPLEAGLEVEVDGTFLGMLV